MTHLTDEIYSVPVPEDVTSFGVGILAMYSGQYYLCYDTNSFAWRDKKIFLPEGEWEALFLSNSVTEEEARGVVEQEKKDGWYMDYEISALSHKKWLNVYLCGSAISSFRSLLSSKQLTGNQAILKLKK